MTISKPIPLSAPDGRIYAYACPRCHHVAGGSEFLVQLPGPSAELRRSSRANADACCRCRRCKAPLTERLGLCAACSPIEAAANEARDAAWAAKQARGAAIIEASLTHALDRDAAVRLRDLMSDISEDLYCAGWLAGLEDALWPMLTGGDRHFGMGEVTEDQAAELRRLHEKAGGWWYWQDDVGATFMTAAEWTAMHGGKS